jgi:hypothetical protein
VELADGGRDRLALGVERLDDQQVLAVAADLALPAVDRADAGQHVDAGGEAPRHQLAGDEQGLLLVSHRGDDDDGAHRDHLSGRLDGESNARHWVVDPVPTPRRLAAHFHASVAGSQRITRTLPVRPSTRTTASSRRPSVT